MAEAEEHERKKGQLLSSVSQLLSDQSPGTQAAGILAVGNLDAPTCAALLDSGEAVRKLAVLNLARQAAAAADVNKICAEVVHLSVEGGGAPFSMDCPLYKRRLQVVAIKDCLAAKRLSLVFINGSCPTTDEKGYTVLTYAPGSTVIITAVPREGGMQQSGVWGSLEFLGLWPPPWWQQHSACSSSKHPCSLPDTPSAAAGDGGSGQALAITATQAKQRLGRCWKALRHGYAKLKDS